MRRAALVLALLCAAVRADVAVRVDGSLLEGTLAVDTATKELVRGKRRYPLGLFHLVEDAHGKLLWAPGFRERLRGYEFLARARMRDALARLAGKACSAKDVELAGSLLDAAEHMGLVGKAAESLAKRVDALARRGAKPPGDKSARIRRDAVALDGLHAEILLQRAKAEKAGSVAGLRLLREALRHPPAPQGALALLESRKPPDFRLGNARFWLDWHLDVELSGASLVSGDELEVKRARHFWRKDLYGVRGGPVLLVTPVRDTRVVGRCLAYGRITCRALSALFKTDQPRARHAKPMTIFLYTGKEEYKAKSGTYAPVEDPAFLEWTNGHYSPVEGLSRFFWYADRDAERRIVGTCVHELTHHWLQEQNPNYAVSQVRRHPGTPGYWILEGFATFMQEGRYDIDGGTWKLFDPRCRSLDVVHALAGKKKLLPWDVVFRVSRREFAGLEREPSIEVLRRWMLGKSKLSAARVFYEQAGAACHYLFHADGGARRGKLIEYVNAAYRGEADRLAIQAAFEMTGHELGRRVEAFAAEVAKGWRPK